MSVCSDGSVGMSAAFLQIELLTDEPQIRWPGASHCISSCCLQNLLLLYRLGSLARPGQVISRDPIVGCLVSCTKHGVVIMASVLRLLRLHKSRATVAFLGVCPNRLYPYCWA
jgi:hypothetical protein